MADHTGRTTSIHGMSVRGKQQIKFAPQSGFPDCPSADHFSQFSGMNVINESVHWNRLSVELSEVYYIVDCTTRHSWRPDRGSISPLFKSYVLSAATAGRRPSPGEAGGNLTLAEAVDGGDGNARTS
jgi:hypothetical protein